MERVKAKKFLGQHFLKDLQIAESIVDALLLSYPHGALLEVGPGMGVLTQFLLQKPAINTWAVEVDRDAVSYLEKKFPELAKQLISESFLDLDFSRYFTGEFAVIGNFPYNISSQIVFKIIDNRALVPCMTGMFQKEVGERICARNGSKAYGIISVITQAFYETEYLFTVSETVFDPPPKVKSGVIKLTRKEKALPCDEKLFRQVVKVAFNQRRKKLRNGLGVYGLSDEQLGRFGSKRAEELSLDDFVELTLLIAQTR